MRGGDKGYNVRFVRYRIECFDESNCRMLDVSNYGTIERIVLEEEGGKGNTVRVVGY